jgi:hypothetical protein
MINGDADRCIANAGGGAVIPLMVFHPHDYKFGPSPKIELDE